MDDSDNDALIARLATQQISPQHVSRASNGIKRKRRSDEAEDIPWTAARCNRLLRSISSRISILQKLSKANRTRESYATAPAQRIATETVVVVIDRPSSQSTNATPLVTPTKDPDWLPRHGAPKDRTRRYGRGARQAEPAKAVAGNTADAALAFPTPFLKRMQRPKPSSTAPPEHDLSLVAQHSAEPTAKSKRKQLPLKFSSSAEEARANLVLAFEALLKATCPATPPVRKSVSSLRSMCLRRVPALVALEESFDEHEDENDKADHSGEIYQDLETLGTRADGGWEGLREVVRAHAVFKVEEAISLGLLDGKACWDLVFVCSAAGPVSEGQKLLEAMIGKGKRCEGDTLRTLRMFAEGNACRGFVLRVLKKQLAKGRVSMEEFCEQTEVVRWMLSALLEPDSHAEAVDLLETFLLQCLRAQWRVGNPGLEKVKAMLVHIAQIVTTMAVMTSEDRSDETHKNITPLPALMQMLSALISGSENEDGKENDNQSRLLPRYFEHFHISNLVLGMQSSAARGIAKGDISTVDAVVQNLRALYGDEDTCISTVSDFVTTVAANIRTFDPPAAHDFLADTIRALLAVSQISVSSSSSACLKQLALKATTAYSEQSDYKPASLLVEEVEGLVLNGVAGEIAVVRTPKAPRTARKYRWEEGLCEWISKTPFHAPRGVQDLEKVPWPTPGASSPSRSFARSDSSQTLPQEEMVPKARDRTQKKKPSLPRLQRRASTVYVNDDDDDEAKEADELALLSTKKSKPSVITQPSEAPARMSLGELTQPIARKPQKRSKSDSTILFARAVESDDELA